MTKLAVSKLPAEMRQLESGPLSPVINDLILAASSGGINAIEDTQKQEAARFLVSAGEASTWLKAGMVLLIALAGIAWGYSRIQPQFRARRQVESVFKWLLLLSSMVAILTTVGIVASESALAAGMVMGVMIIPFVSSLSDDVIKAVPQAMRDGSLGMGATKSETIRQVVLPAALPGIVGGILLAVSRAIGETMIVLMAAGLAANLSVNPLDAVTTVTAQIVTLLTGDQEFDSPKTLAAFALALMLFVVTLFLNVIALHVPQVP